MSSQEFVYVVALKGISLAGIIGAFVSEESASEAAKEAIWREESISDGYHSVMVLKVPLGRLTEAQAPCYPGDKMRPMTGSQQSEEVVMLKPQYRKSLWVE